MIAIYEGIRDSLAAIAEFFGYLLHPIDSLMMLINWLLDFVPSVSNIFILFYVITGSRRVIRTLGIILLSYVFIRMAFAYNLESLILIVILAILAIRYIGGGV